MKNSWNRPTLEVLDVNMTLASTVIGPYTDEAYNPGNPVDLNNPETWKRFGS